MNTEKPYSFPLGSSVIIELFSGDMIDGTIDHYSQNFIKLRNCREHRSEAPLQSKRLYRTQISNILTLDDTNCTLLINADTSLSTTSESNNSSALEEPEQCNSPVCSDTNTNSSKRILLPKHEYLRLKDLTKTFVYMGIVDSRYYEAVDVLKNCETIGMCGFIENIKNLSILALSSWDKVYVFDIQLFHKGAIPEELREILEMSSIQKVTHHGRHLIICLKEFYKLEVRNLFDTQVADFKIRMQEKPELEEFTVKNINEILSTYLHFPNNIIHKHEVIEWKHRPLNEEYRRCAAESVAYMITLKNTLERILLKDFYEAVSKYTTNFDDLTAFELSDKFSQIRVHRRELN